MSSQPGYVGTVKSGKVDTLQYFQGGSPLGTADLVNDAGFVTAADAPNADWAQADPTKATFVRNKPNLAAVALSGSASDITGGTLPVSSVPYLSTDVITDGVLSLARLPVIPAGYVSGLAPIATEGDLWTGNNTASLPAGFNFPLGPGGLTVWNRDSASGLTAFANNRGTNSPGGWEWVGYRSDGGQENVAATLTTAGVLNVSGGFSVSGSPLARVAMSGSASDITTGTLPRSVLPPTDKSSVSTGAYGSDLNPDTNGAYLIGSSSYQWKAVYAQSVVVNGAPLATLATSGSASDISSGTLNVQRLPQIPAAQVASGSFVVGSFSTSLLPSALGTYDLGSSALAWRNAVFTGTLTVGGRSVQPVALSGSASDLTTGTLPVAQVPQLPAGTVTSGSFTVGSFSASVVPTGSTQTLGTAAAPWNQAYFTNGTFGGVLGGGARTDRCQLGLYGTSLSPASTSYFGLGIGTVSGSTRAAALEYHVDGPSSDHVWYANTTELFRATGGGQSTSSLLPGANGGQTLGAFNKQWLGVFAQSFFMNGLPLQQVCVSASASDITQGTLPLAQVPALPASRLSVQSGLSIDLVPANAGTGNVGTSVSPWGNVWAGQIYRNGTPLAAVATSGNLTDLNQPFSTGNQQPYAVTVPGSYLYYGRVAGSGRTTFASQRGTGSAGGFEFLTYSGSGTVEGVSGGPLLVLDNGGSATVAGGVRAMGSGGLLVRSFDETATYSAGANTFRFQGRPLDSSLVTGVNWASGSYAFGAAAQSSKFSARLSGYLTAPLNDTYTFQVTFKDGVRVWLNSLKVVDSWSLQGSGAATATFSVTLGVGGVPLMVETFVGVGPGTLQIQWKGAANNTAYQPLVHGTGTAAMGLGYDMYENPTSQMGTLWCNGPVYAPSISNNGSGVSLADKVDLAGNALTGVSFLSNNGSQMTVSAPLALGGNTVAGLGSLGVGTGSPATAVDISAKSGGYGQLRLTASDLADASIGFGGTQGSFSSGSAWVMGRGVYNAGQNFALGQTGPGGILYVQGGSKPALGVNQANPSYSLDVLGSANVSGTLYCNQIVSNSVQTTSTSSQTSIASTLYVVQGTGVGINQSSPGASLDVTGTGRFTGLLTTASVTTPKLNADNSALAIGASVYVKAGSTTMVGVNQPSPQSTLDVMGTTNVSGAAKVGGGLTTTSVVAPSGTTLALGQGSNGSSLYLVGNSVGVFQSSPQATLDVAGSANVSNAFSAAEVDTPAINSSGQALGVCGVLTVASGKVGVGQTSPQTTLDVSGSLRATTSVATSNVETTTINSSKSALTVGTTLYFTAGSTPSLGVFNASPAASLDLTGTMRVSGAVTMPTSVQTPVLNPGGQTLTVGSALTVSGAGVGVFQPSPKAALDVAGAGQFSSTVTASELVTPLINSAKGPLTVGNSVYVTGGSNPMVGIMTASPGAALDVTGSVRSSVGVTAPSLVGDTLNPRTANGPIAVSSTLFVTSTGVGVYAANPGASLDVNGSGRFSTSLSVPALTVQTVNAGGTAMQLGSNVYLSAGGKVGVGQPSPSATVDVVGNANFTGTVTAGSFSGPNVGSTSGSTTYSGAISVVYPSSGSGAPSVGIMQTSPSYSLDVSGSARVTQNAVIAGGLTTPSLGNQGSGITISETVAASGLVTPLLNAGGQNLQVGSAITVLTPANATAPYVGICKTSPGTQLDVTGSMAVSGSGTIGSVVTSVINAADQALQVGSGVTVSGKMVGVGKTPTVPLDVVGAATVTGLATLNGGLVTPVINGSSQGLNVANAFTITGGSSSAVGLFNGNPKQALDVIGNAAFSGKMTAASLTTPQINPDNSALVLGSCVYMTGGTSPMVGINQNPPAYTLDVAGNGRVSQGLTTTALQLGNEALKIGSAVYTTSGTQPSVGICNQSPGATLDVTGNLNVSQGATVSGLTTGTINGGLQALQVGNGITVTSGTTPKVGICNATPSQALDVTGSVNASVSVITPVLNGGSQPLDMVGATMSVRTGKVGVSTTSPGATLDVQGGGTFNAKTSVTSPALYCSTINSTNAALTVCSSVYVSNSGSPKVGVNVASPNAMLHVSNDIRSSTLYTGSVNQDGTTLSLVASNAILSSSALSIAVATTVSVAQNQALTIKSAAPQGGQVFMAFGNAQSNNNCGYLNWCNNGGTGSASNAINLGMWGQAGNAISATASGVAINSTSTPSYALQVGNIGATSNTAYVAGPVYSTDRVTALASVYTPLLVSDSSNLTILCGGLNTGYLGAGLTFSNTTALSWSQNGVTVPQRLNAPTLVTGSISNGGNGINVSETTTVPKLVLPNAQSFTGQLSELSGYTLVVTGSITIFGGNYAPSGYLSCDGSAVSRVFYGSLYGVIGTSYGSGDGNSTFNVPNLQGRVPVGYVPNQADGNFQSYGQTGGEDTHTLSYNEMPSHAHGVNDYQHSHGQILGGSGYPQGPLFSDAHGGSNAYRLKDNIAASGTQLVTSTNYANIGIQNSGSSQAHNNLQPYLVIQYIIKT